MGRPEVLSRGSRQARHRLPLHGSSLRDKTSPGKWTSRRARMAEPVRRRRRAMSAVRGGRPPQAAVHRPTQVLMPGRSPTAATRMRAARPPSARPHCPSRTTAPRQRIRLRARPLRTGHRPRRPRHPPRRWASPPSSRPRPTGCPRHGRGSAVQAIRGAVRRRTAAAPRASADSAVLLFRTTARSDAHVGPARSPRPGERARFCGHKCAQHPGSQQRTRRRRPRRQRAGIWGPRAARRRQRDRRGRSTQRKGCRHPHGRSACRRVVHTSGPGKRTGRRGPVAATAARRPAARHPAAPSRLSERRRGGPAARRPIRCPADRGHPDGAGHARQAPVRPAGGRRRQSPRRCLRPPERHPPRRLRR